MEIMKLKARTRIGSGKSYTHKVRGQGWIPAVYYGHDRETRSIEVDEREFAALVRAKKTAGLIVLQLPGETGDTTTIVKEIQRHVIKSSLFYHVDFQHVAMDEKITVNVPVHIFGLPIGVKDDGGILNQAKRTLAVECFPADIPEVIEIDVTELRIGHSIHVKELTVPKGVIKDSPDDVVAVVVHPKAVVEEVPVAAEGAEAAEAKEGEEGGEAGEEKAKPEAKGKEAAPEGKKSKDEKSADKEK